MADRPFRQLSIDPLAGYDPVVGRALWQLEATRRSTEELLDSVPAGELSGILEWAPSPDANSIATLLYHIVAVEMDWLHDEILETPFPGPIGELLPHPMRDDTGHLAVITGDTLTHHRQRLSLSREHFLQSLVPMNERDFRRLRHLPDYDVTPEWVIFHLIEHECKHRGHIAERLATRLGRRIS